MQLSGLRSAVLLLFAILVPLPAYTAEAFIPPSAASFRIIQSQFTTKAYEEAALNVLLDEANSLARSMKLHENLPIKVRDLLQVRISKPFWSENARTFGVISTSNYHYYASVDNKLSYIVRNLGKEDTGEAGYLEAIRVKYAAPKSQVDTNKAYKIATQWLAAASVDIKELERSSKATIRVWDLGRQYVPVYWVVWEQPHLSFENLESRTQPVSRPVATLQFLEPETRLLQMHVEKGKYLMRKPLAVPGRDSLLQTEDPQLRELFAITEDYRTKALRALIAEANKMARKLSLAQPLPITEPSLIEARVDFPSVSLHYGHFGTIATKEYVFTANVSNKVAYISKNFRYQDESSFLDTIRRSWLSPLAKVNTNAAYTLATQWLAAASVDFTALERDCRVQITYLRPEPDDKFVPIYKVVWFAKRVKPVATVEIFEPEQVLLKLWVEDAAYLGAPALNVVAGEGL
jgi:hypothetical protein